MALACKRLRSENVFSSTLLLGDGITSTPNSKSSKSKRFTAKGSTKKLLDERFGDTSIDASPHNSTLGSDLMELFCEPKTTTKSKSPKSKKQKLKHVHSFDLDLLDRPMNNRSAGIKNNIEGVFDKFLEKDPFASLGKFILRERPISPERPLTLFSPVKDKPRTFSAPQNRSRIPEEVGPRAIENHVERWTSKAVNSAKRELILDGRSPLYRRNLDAAAYSPCPTSKVSRVNTNGWPCMNESTESLTYSPLPSCSTPVAQTPLFKTPSAPGCRSVLREPLSGVKSLFQEKSFSSESPISVTSTPRPGNSSHHSYMSPAYVDDGSCKSTLLLGVTCYVDVKYNKEDRSESVQKEVISLGAKVEKNFTKKVTHVIFKGGKMSTYMKAKELNIPIVSLLWLEACKVVGNMVDPAIYPPANDEEYKKNVPIEEDKKRERFLRRGRAFLDRLNGILPQKAPRTKSNKKPVSATEGKKKPVRATSKVVKLKTKVPKKLDFNPSGGRRDKKSTDSDSDYVSESDTESVTTNVDQPKRRKSAPATLGDEKQLNGQQKLTDFFDRQPENQNALKTPPRQGKKTQSDLLKVLTGGYVTNEKKKRKLFDPNESHMSQPLLATPEDMSPYLKPSPPKSRSRTTSSKRSQKARVVKRPAAARKSLVPLMENEEDDLSAMTSRNSLACFELDRKTKHTAKDRPRIAFTCIPKEDIPRYKTIVNRLGGFSIDSSVSRKTTHLLTTATPVVKRTMNLLKALARGCWILDVLWVPSPFANEKFHWAYTPSLPDNNCPERRIQASLLGEDRTIAPKPPEVVYPQLCPAPWLIHSDENNKWMSEEPFELKSFSEAVVQCRLEKQAFGKDYSMDLFSGIGSIFVDSDAQAPRSDIIELLKLCCAKVVNVSNKADIIVSSRPLDDSNPDVTLVSHLWVLDSITNNKRFDLEQYKIS